jgi:hypothetical protein
MNFLGQSAPDQSIRYIRRTICEIELIRGAGLLLPQQHHKLLGSGITIRILIIIFPHGLARGAIITVGDSRLILESKNERVMSRFVTRSHMVSRVRRG